MDKNKVIESAAKLIAKGAFDKAVKEYQRVLEVDPDDVRVLQKLAELYQKMQRRDEAADCFEKVAKTYAAQGFYLKAVALYKQVLKVVDRIEVNVRLAELYQQLGLVGDATKEWQNVAAHYEKVGDLKASLDTLRRLVDLDPDNVAARIRLGEQYARQDNLVEAVAELRVAERISHLDQGDVPLAKELAEHYLSRGDSKRALAKLQICFKANPRDLGTLQMLARAFQELGQVSKTVSVLKELARVHGDAGRTDEAKRVYKQGLDLAPDDAEMQASLDALASAPAASPSPPRAPTAPSGVRPITSPGPVPIRPPTPRADRTATPLSTPAAPVPPPRTSPPITPPSQAGAGGPVSVPKLLKETEVYVKYGLHEKALEHLKRIFSAEPENAEAHEKMRQLAAAMGKPQDAVPSLATLLQLYAARSDPRAAEVRAQLAQLEPGHPALSAGPKLGAPVAQQSGEAIVVSDDVEEVHEVEVDDTDDVQAFAATDVELVQESRAAPSDEDDVVVHEAEVDAEVQELDAAAEHAARSASDDSDVISVQDDEDSLVIDESDGEVVAEPEAALAAPVAAHDDAFVSDLAEADFYLQQGLADDARAIVESILLADPEHAAAQRMLARVEAASEGSAAPDARPAAAQDDLAAELAAELAEEVAELGAAADPDQPLTGADSLDSFQVPADEVLGEFRAKINETVRPEDAQTHYDLGIAYKEMGLLDEAIAEFEVALRHGGGVRKLDCISMLGVCAMEKGRAEDAIQVFQNGLAEPDLSESAKRALSFELGAAYETLGENALALSQYEDVERGEPDFRDVAARIQRLGGTISGPKARVPARKPTTPSMPPPAVRSAPPPSAQQRGASAPRPPSGPIAQGPVATARPEASPSAAAAAEPKPTSETGLGRNRKIGFV